MLYLQFFYRAITKPFQSDISYQTVIIATLLSWSISVAVNIPYAMSIEYEKDTCWNNYSSAAVALIYCGLFLVFGWVLPLVITAGAYVWIAMELNKSHLRSVTAINSRYQENEKVFQMFIIIVVAFFVLTMPFPIFYLIANYNFYHNFERFDIKSMLDWNYGLFTLSLINSCINPIIYSKMHRQMNKFLKECCCIRGIIAPEVTKESQYGLQKINSTSGRAP